jgi:hypothetical protein
VIDLYEQWLLDRPPLAALTELADKTSAVGPSRTVATARF